MPNLSEYQPNPEHEERYRRGYAHGIRAALDGLAPLLSEPIKQKLDVWFANELSLWARDKSQSELFAPDFPKLD